MMRRLYRCLLRAYPASLREQYGREMTMVLDEAWTRASARGWRSRVRFASRMLADFVRSLPGAWHERPRPIQPPKKDLRIVTMMREIRLAVRVLWHDRWSAAATILTLALAIGATTAVFSVVHAVVLRPLPYANPDGLVTIYEHNIVRNNTRNPIGPANLREWRDRATSFTSITAYIDGAVTVTGDGPPEELDLKYVAWDLFDILGVRPARGRSFRLTDSADNAPRKAIISWRLWQRRYHGDPDVIGRSVQLGGQPVEVIGVMPPDFRLMGRNADVWWQIRYSAAQREPGGRGWYAIARLRPGVSVETARAEMNTIAAELEQKWPAFDSGWRVTVLPMKEDMTGDVKLPLLLMLGAVGIVLVAGCASTINLLLARASSRRREMAVRAALGATRWQIVRQLASEGMVLAATGAAGGVLIAGLALRALATMAVRLGIPRLDEAVLSTPVLLVSLGIMAACALAFSLVPAIQSAHSEAATPLASGGRWSTAHRKDRHIRQLLVVTQVACAVVLVIAGGLITRSLVRLISVNPGFDQQAYTFTVSLPNSKYPQADGRAQRFFEETVTRLRNTPGIEAASFMGFLPFKGMGTATSFTRADQPKPPAGQEPVADIRPIDSQYLDVMRVAVLKGRNFTAAEVASKPNVCIISETTARSAFGEDDPLGKWLNIDLDGGPDQIVGVAADVRHSDLRTAPRPMIYYPFGRYPLGFANLVVRSGLDDAATKAAAEAIVRDIDKDIPVTDAQRMRDLVSASVASPAAAARVVGAFAILALVLSLVGVGALLAAVVATRMPEFGVRLALGATPGNIRRLVLRQGGALIGAGLAIGLGIAIAVSRGIEQLLFGAKPLEPAIYAGTIIAIAALAFFAADIPARRATKANPADALR